jgi:hypothetical protein
VGAGHDYFSANGFHNMVAESLNEKFAFELGAPFPVAGAAQKANVRLV